MWKLFNHISTINTYFLVLHFLMEIEIQRVLLMRECNESNNDEAVISEYSDSE